MSSLICQGPRLPLDVVWKLAHGIMLRRVGGSERHRLLIRKYRVPSSTANTYEIWRIIPKSEEDLGELV